METIGLILSLTLTLMVLSYILGDNPLFKLAEHIFVGVSVGYAILVAWHLVIVPAASWPLVAKLPPFLLGFLLIFKILPVQSKIVSALGSVSLAFLIGVGAAAAIGGALLGTLYPQALSTAAINLNFNNPLYADAPYPWMHNQWLSNLVIILGVIGTFFYFTFTHRPKGFLGGFREGFVNFFAGMGRWVILITLGALFANTVSARIALLVSRITFLVNGFQSLK
ncbi:MAG TPA: hypothetical protein G4N96_06825 [Chloroflexi bacterium]|nr:hypothetical protein [Chloroflexota bacterium]